MDTNEAKRILEEKEGANRAEIEAKRTMENAKLQVIEDARREEIERAERKEFLKERLVNNFKKEKEVKKQLIKGIEQVHFVEGMVMQCEKCGHELDGPFTIDAMTEMGTNMRLIKAECYKCSFCHHTEVFNQGFRMRQIKGEVFNLFQ